MDLIAALFDLSRTTSRPIIAIDGPAGAGKTTLAEHISAAMSLKYKCLTLHMDDLYNGWEEPFDNHLTDALKFACESHRKNQKFSLSTFNWSKGEYGPAQELGACELLILEGVGSSQSQIRELLTASIWIDIEPLLGLERVLTRDGESLSANMTSWLAMQAKHFAENGSRDAADFILTT